MVENLYQVERKERALKDAVRQVLLVELQAQQGLKEDEA